MGRQWFLLQSLFSLIIIRKDCPECYLSSGTCSFEHPEGLPCLIQFYPMMEDSRLSEAIDLLLTRRLSTTIPERRKEKKKKGNKNLKHEKSESLPVNLESK